MNMNNSNAANIIIPTTPITNNNNDNNENSNQTKQVNNSSQPNTPKKFFSATLRPLPNQTPLSTIRKALTPKAALTNPTAGGASEVHEQQANYIKETLSTAVTAAVPLNPINYRNGKKIEPVLLSFSNYYAHRETLPQHYHPLVQYLEKTELKYHNDNLYEDSPIGFPTRAQILRERTYHLPIIKSTPAEKARYKRKLAEKQAKINLATKKYDFKTYDNYSSHYFLTGGRFNRNDTIDSKILIKYGVFVNRNNPESVHIKDTERATENFKRDMRKMKTFASLHNQGWLF